MHVATGRGHQITLLATNILAEKAKPPNNSDFKPDPNKTE